MLQLGDIFYCLNYLKNHKERAFLQPHISAEATTLVSYTAKIQKFKLVYFQNERRYGARNFYKDLFLGHLQPGVDKNSEGLAILILEFEDVMGKTIRRRLFNQDVRHNIIL